MLENLTTEKRNKKTENLDTLPLHELLKIMNDEDKKVAFAVEKELDQIEKAIEAAVEQIQKGGRLIYIGAGTSGRLGILDAVECRPTFSTTDEVLGLIAGGERAFVKAVEGAEDSRELAQKDLEDLSLNSNDIVFGIAASGRTPYVIGALQYAEKTGAKKIAFSCNKNAEISKYADIAIEVDCGAEVLTGSTRLKAGTAQKLVLNMVSTASMVRIGKVYGNLMVDVRPTNAKLIERSKRIIMEAAGVSYDLAEKTLELSGHNVKAAIVMILNSCSYEEALERLEKTKGFIRSI